MREMINRRPAEMALHDTAGRLCKSRCELFEMRNIHFLDDREKSAYRQFGSQTSASVVQGDCFGGLKS